MPRIVVTAQKTDYLFKHITTANGLVNNQVSVVVQDSRGFVWIGTQTGLQRYDGKRFTTYLADVHNPDALQSDWIQTIFEDSQRRLWIGTTVAGVSLLNRNTEKFYNFNLHLGGGAKKISGIWQFLEDREGAIWLCAFDGIYKFNESNQQFGPVNELLKIKSNVAASSIAIDSAGNLWFSTTAGIKMLENDTKVIFDHDNNPRHLAVFELNNAVSSIAFDKKNNIWISTGYDHILYRYSKTVDKLKPYSFIRPYKDGKTGDAQPREFIGGLFICSNGALLIPLLSRGIAEYNYAADSFHIINAANNDPHGLHAEMTTFGSIFLQEDREKNIWIATDAGINTFNLEKPRFITYGLPLKNDAGLQRSGEVSNFLQTSEGDVYISYYTANGGIKQFDKNLNFKKHYLWKGKINYDADENQLWGLFQDNNGTIWAPNQVGNILQLNVVTEQVTILKDSALHGAVNQIKQDADNNIWLAHDRKGLLKIDAHTKEVTRFGNFLHPEGGNRRRVRCLLLDDEKIWVGTILNGLQLFDKKSGTFTASFMLNESNSRSISNNNIIDILAYNKDTLIVATLGGINIFDKREKTFTAILSKDGLPNNLVQAIILDDDKNLWAAFAGGLSKIDLHTYSITNYDENDGIVDNRFNAFSRLHDGRLLIGASNSFLAFDPKKIMEAGVPPDVTITSFKVFEKPVAVDSLINTAAPLLLSYKDNDLHIEFAALQFQSPKNNRYYYQLAGIDKDWLTANADQSISYNQLPPGHYVFNVKCANRAGVFSKNSTRLSIHIIPPFWERWWFITLMTVVLGCSLYAVIRWREKNITALESGKTRVQQLTAEKYKAQFESEQISNFFSTSLFDKNDVDDVLWDVAKNLIGKLGFVDCMIYLWNDDRTRMVQKAGYGLKGSLEELEKKHFDVVPGQGVVGAVMQSGEAIIIPDTTIDERYRVDELDRLSEICVPVKYNEQLVGIIDSEHHEKNFFTRHHLQAMTTIATLVASKIKSIEADQRLRQQKAELAEINQQLAEVQLAALRSQMNPHFIFNALNSIKKFVIANEPVNAEKYLGKFSKLIRSILDNSRSGMVTLEKELQLLHLYLELEQLRFGSKLSYSIRVDDSLQISDVEIPSMIVQPFVENAMLHGIMHRDDGGCVTVYFRDHSNWLEVIIEDNGVGRAKSAEFKSNHDEPHQSIGIQVATKRLEALKTNAETPAGITIIDLETESGLGTGTRIIVAIPIS